MDQNDDEEFGNQMAALSKHYEKDFGNDWPITLETYFQALAEFTIEQVIAGISHLIAHREYPTFPQPGEIRAHIEGDQKELALMAWNRVDNAVRRIGPYESVDFTDDRAINSTIQQMGGWPSLGEVSTKEWQWKRKEFENLYPIMRKKTDHPEYLEGIIELENAKRPHLIEAAVERGYITEQPVRLYDGVKVKLLRGVLERMDDDISDRPRE